MPDGFTSYPGQDLPPIRVTIEKLKYGDENAQEFAELVDHFNKKLFRSDADDISALPEFVDGASPKDAKTKINYAIFRLLSFSFFDIHLKEVLTKKDGISRLEPKTFQDKVAELAENLPALGMDHTEHLIQLDPNNGLTYVFEMVKRNPHILPSQDRASFPNVYKVIVYIKEVVEAIADDEIDFYALTWKNVYRRVEQQFAAGQYADYESEPKGENAGVNGSDTRTRTPQIVQDDSDSDDGQDAPANDKPDFAAIARRFTTNFLKTRQPFP
ncbi:hypothetical protein DL768_011166 [Monosporascus sp. mg162]|nr:hypothetical protein DL768_011166 [Monosporascus sp. mg162]